MQTRLARDFNQQPAGRTMVGTSTTVELLMSETGSWSVLLSFPDGSACLIDQAGPGERLPPPPFVSKR